jgi:transposase InsO family protein
VQQLRRRVQILSVVVAGIRVIRTPHHAPNCNAHAERFVRSLKEECLDRIIPIGERHVRRTLTDYVAHYHGERNHQGLDNELIEFSDITRWNGRRGSPRLLRVTL